jgi:hypothetical protein
MTGDIPYRYGHIWYGWWGTARDAVNVVRLLMAYIIHIMYYLPGCVEETLNFALTRGFNHVETDHCVVVQDARMIRLDKAHATLWNTTFVVAFFSVHSYSMRLLVSRASKGQGLHKRWWMHGIMWHERATKHCTKTLDARKNWPPENNACVFLLLPTISAARLKTQSTPPAAWVTWRQTLFRAWQDRLRREYMISASLLSCSQTHRRNHQKIKKYLETVVEAAKVDKVEFVAELILRVVDNFSKESE